MKAFLKGFAYAWHGILAAVKAERNLRFHLCAAVFVWAFSGFYHLQRAEKLLLVILVFGVLSLEIINSALERMVDEFSPGHSQRAGQIKDMAAGAVLVFCTGAVICGFLLFWDTAVFARVFAYFAQNPWRFVLLAAFGAACICFVFGGKNKCSNDNGHTQEKT